MCGAYVVGKSSFIQDNASRKRPRIEGLRDLLSGGLKAFGFILEKVDGILHPELSSKIDGEAFDEI
jgi:hypothetical protein